MYKKLIAILFLALNTAASWAQTDWPTRPIKFVVPTAPGGPTDLVARQYADRLGALLKQPVVVENRPGGGHLVGMAAVAQAQADGYTFGVVTTPLVVNPALHAKMPYDTEKDLEPVALLTNQPLILVTSTNSSLRSLQALLDLARGGGKPVNMGSAGNATGPHLAGALLGNMAKVNFTHVAYKGGPQATMATISGEVDFYFDTPAAALPHIRDGKLRALAVTSPSRMVLLPDVPTVSEAGYKDFDFNSFSGLVAPRGTPKELLLRLQSEVKRISEQAEFKDRLAATGMEVVGTDSESFRKLIARELPKWRSIVSTGNIKAD